MRTCLLWTLFGGLATCALAGESPLRKADLDALELFLWSLRGNALSPRLTETFGKQ